jgi:tetratricopeptide (TPR) repeat protein
MKHLALAISVFALLTIPCFAQNQVEIILEKVGEYDRDGKFQEAVDEIGKAIEIQPNNADLYIRRANLNLFTEKKAEVLKDAKKAASIDPTDKKILYFSAQVLQQTQQYEEALKIAEALMALGDVNWFGWQLLVNIKMHLDDFVGAFDSVTTAIELFPQVASLKQNQANLLRLMGDSDKALEMFTVLINKSTATLKKAKTEEEKQSIKRDLSMFLFSRARLNVSKFYKTQGTEDANAAVELLPEKFSYISRARIFLDLKMYDEALADFTKAIDFAKNDDDEDVSFLMSRGDVYFNLKRYADALKDYEQIIKIDEKRMRVLLQERINFIKQKIAEDK